MGDSSDLFWIPCTHIMFIFFIPFALQPQKTPRLLSIQYFIYDTIVSKHTTEMVNIFRTLLFSGIFITSVATAASSHYAKTGRCLSTNNSRAAPLLGHHLCWPQKKSFININYSTVSNLTYCATWRAGLNCQDWFVGFGGGGEKGRGSIRKENVCR